MKNNLLGLTDKNGIELHAECIIYGCLPGHKAKHYFNLGYSPNDGSIEMMASTYGYVHKVQQKDLANFEYIGPTAENLHLLQCD